MREDKTVVVCFGFSPHISSPNASQRRASGEFIFGQKIDPHENNGPQSATTLPWNPSNSPHFAGPMFARIFSTARGLLTTAPELPSDLEPLATSKTTHSGRYSSKCFQLIFEMCIECAIETEMLILI